jgi:hypothetical protein
LQSHAAHHVPEQSPPKCDNVPAQPSNFAPVTALFKTLEAMFTYFLFLNFSLNNEVVLYHEKLHIHYPISLTQN